MLKSALLLLWGLFVGVVFVSLIAMAVSPGLADHLGFGGTAEPLPGSGGTIALMGHQQTRRGGSISINRGSKGSGGSLTVTHTGLTIGGLMMSKSMSYDAISHVSVSKYGLSRAVEVVPRVGERSLVAFMTRSDARRVAAFLQAHCSVQQLG